MSCVCGIVAVLVAGVPEDDQSVCAGRLWVS
jgi:hypothetical protein